MAVFGSAIEEIDATDIDNLASFVSDLTEPHVLRGVASDWPLVQRALQSRAALGDYLTQFYSGAPLITSLGSPAIKGRIGYNDSFTGFNYERTQMSLGEFLGQIEDCAQKDEPPAVYVGSSLLERWFPGIDSENSLQPTQYNTLASLWLGNQIVVSAHFDFPDNLACCVAGRRRFILFPPDQLQNLYVGPWDITPAGQPISLVDIRSPDLDRFPRFAHAMDAALTAILEPGDALFIPSMWWHHVEGLDYLNILLNYWWRETPAYTGSPLHVLKHAFMSIRSLPPDQREYWKNIFDYHVFDASEESIAHIPEAGRGIHGPMDENRARALRAELLSLLNR